MQRVLLSLVSGSQHLGSQSWNSKNVFSILNPNFVHIGLTYISRLCTSIFSLSLSHTLSFNVHSPFWASIDAGLVVNVIPCDDIISASGSWVSDGKHKSMIKCLLKHLKDVKPLGCIWQVCCSVSTTIPFSWIWMTCLKKIF